MQFRHEQAQTAGQQQQREATPKNPAIPSFKVGRNEPCPCGSGKKYKQCHGKLS